METYETIFILQPELTEEDAESVTKGFEEILAAEKASLVKSERWGKKRLAYRVRKHWEGYYVFFEHNATPAALNEFERRLRIHDHVIKWMSVRKDPRAAAEEERKAARLAKMQQRAAAAATRPQDETSSEEEES